jgi:hypothetical protein
MAGLVLFGLRPNESKLGDALIPETLTRSARYILFIPHRFQEQVLDALVIKNPTKCFAGFLVVDYVSEISNLELMGDVLAVTNLYFF